MGSYAIPVIRPVIIQRPLFLISTSISLGELLVLRKVVICMKFRICMKFEIFMRFGNNLHKIWNLHHSSLFYICNVNITSNTTSRLSLVPTDKRLFRRIPETTHFQRKFWHHDCSGINGFRNSIKHFVVFAIPFFLFNEINKQLPKTSPFTEQQIVFLPNWQIFS